MSVPPGPTPASAPIWVEWGCGPVSRSFGQSSWFPNDFGDLLTSLLPSWGLKGIEMHSAQSTMCLSITSQASEGAEGGCRKSAGQRL